jgi:SAM-dependent methyltransferase
MAALDRASRIGRAVASNLFASCFPSAYLRLTGQTGRGDRSGETPDAVAEYFLRCFGDYFDKLEVPDPDIERFLAGKRLVEYGPGDIPGVALLMYAAGAEHVACVDRFPMFRPSAFAAEVIRILVASLPPHRRLRAQRALNDAVDPAQGLRAGCVEYLVTRDGLSGLHSEVDLVYSRAVLEHVNDIAGTFDDMSSSLRAGGIAIHLVDLKSHGLHSQSALDFLAWPSWMWWLMYSAKGVPNRWRIDRYRAEANRVGLAITRLIETDRYEASELSAVRPALAREFAHLSDAELAVKGFWMICEKR